MCKRWLLQFQRFSTFVGVGVNMSKSAVPVSVPVSVSKFALLVSVRFRLGFYLGVTEYQPTFFFQRSILSCETLLFHFDIAKVGIFSQLRKHFEKK